MAFDLVGLASIRPFLFHLTAQENLLRIRRLRRLDSAAQSALMANAPGSINGKRAQHLDLAVGGETVRLRDQAPLYEGNVEFQGHWDFQRLLAELNRRVFFWPGTAMGPSAYGQRHFERYQSEVPALLRVPTANMPAGAESCRFNSGSPRCSKGARSPRGPQTFLPFAEAPYSAARAVEITWLGEVELPEGTQIGTSPTGPWTPLG